MTFSSARTRQKMQVVILIFLGFMNFGMGPKSSSNSKSPGPNPNHILPGVGELCPSSATYDGLDCFFGTAPAGTTAFTYNNAFYSTPLPGHQCSIGTFDGANCFFRNIPSGYSSMEALALFIFRQVKPTQFFWVARRRRLVIYRPGTRPGVVEMKTQGQTFSPLNSM